MWGGGESGVVVIGRGCTPHVHLCKSTFIATPPPPLDKLGHIFYMGEDGW